jgi:TDG/mug DNA glycosylase family protein
MFGKSGGAVLPDVLAPGLDVVFCGSAAGRVSAELGAYYAGPGNRFWPILHATGLTPRQLPPEEFRRALDYGIGLTDISKFQSGADSALDTEGDDAQALAAKIERHAPHVLAFNGKRAARVFFADILDAPLGVYGLQRQKFGATALFVLPSTSGAARRWWDAAPWEALAEYL